jgi:crotonobetainyl-CoA:carnitine CoA-transferase CaiB-like acyl-CoA transferase
MPGILDGITVIDLTQNVAGPFCAQLLGDFGATVIKVERPGRGDDTRQWGPPFWQGESAAFLALNRNKKSICVDLKHPEGKEIIYKLVTQADVFVHSMKPESAEKLGFGYEDLSKINPALIYGSISGFGEEGPLRQYPGYDPLIQAYSGIMSITGHPGDAPVRVGASLVDMGSGMWLLIGILVALHQRHQTGQGAKVSNSLLETGVTWSSLQLINYIASGNVPGKIGTAMPMIAPYEAFKTIDDWVMIAAGNDRLFENLCRALGLEHLAENDKFKTNAERVKNRTELHQIIEERTQTLTVNEVLETLRQNGVPCGPINTLDKVYEDEQVNALGMIKSVDSFRISDYKMVDIPVSVNKKRAEIQSLPPKLGEHTDEIMEQAGYSSEQIASLRSAGVIA